MEKNWARCWGQRMGSGLDRSFGRRMVLGKVLPLGTAVGHVVGVELGAELGDFERHLMRVLGRLLVPHWV